jgi:hypothetical protein
LALLWVFVAATAASTVATPVTLFMIARRQRLVDLAHQATVDRIASAERAEQTKLGKVIHVLVNSNLAISKKAEHRATQSNAILLREMIRRDELGGTPNPSYVTALHVAEARLQELDVELSAGEVQNQNADVELADQAAFAARAPQR